MAINTYADLSATPANNADLLGNDATGNAGANTIDTLIQNLAAMTARFYGDIGGQGTIGGSGDAITLTSNSTYQVLQSGIIVGIKAGAANTGAATLNLDSLGAKPIRKAGDVALAAGDIAADGRYLLIYDEDYNSSAGAWVLLNPQGISASSTVTLTNKRITPRVASITSAAEPAINTDNCDIANIASLATNVSNMSTNLTGTPTAEQVLIVKIKDDGTPRTISWGSAFVSEGGPLPTTTTASKQTRVAFVWNGSKWASVGFAQEA